MTVIKIEGAGKHIFFYQQSTPGHSSFCSTGSLNHPSPCPRQQSKNQWVPSNSLAQNTAPNVPPEPVSSPLPLSQLSGKTPSPAMLLRVPWLNGHTPLVLPLQNDILTPFFAI